MAKGSEKFSWSLFPGAKKVCWRCKRELRVQDVADHRRRYPGTVTEFLCVDCKRADVEALIRENRKSLGLDER